MKTILVPTDFSSTANSAIDVAVNIAKKAGAELILLHIIEDVDEDSFNVVGEASSGVPVENRLFTMKLIQKSKHQLAEAVDQASLSGLKVSGKLRVGNAYHNMNQT